MQGGTANPSQELWTATHASLAGLSLPPATCEKRLLVQLEEFASAETSFTDHPYSSYFSETWLHEELSLACSGDAHA